MTSAPGTMRGLQILLSLALLEAGLGAQLHAQDFPRFGDDLHRPLLRQPGKDVMRLPTPDALVERMLAAAKTTNQDIVYDLGAYVEGENLGFTFVGLDGDVRSVRARIDGTVLSGTLRFAGNPAAVTGRRR